MKVKYITIIIPMVLFLIIGCVSVYYVTARPKSIIDTPEAQLAYVPAAGSLAGAAAIGKAWKEYPDYMIGFSVLAGLGFGGAILCAYNASVGSLQDE